MFQDTWPWDGSHWCTSRSCGCGKPVNLRKMNGRTTPIHVRDQAPD